METKEKIKLRIRALLAKTTDNGATEAEMMEAMAKASELMEKYYIDHNDINDPFLGEKCIFGKERILNIGYKINYFYPSLARLFDCEYYFTKKEITFFGFEQDVELCLYFYKVIVRTCYDESQRYKSSREFKEKTIRYHSKTITNSFTKGFIFRVCEKLDEIYKARQQERTTERGLVLRDKGLKVKDLFKKEGLKIRMQKDSKVSVLESVFEKGSQAGDRFSITQGIKQGSQSNRKQLG